MRGVVCAVSVGRFRSTSTGTPSPTLVLDPSDDEISSLEGGGCFAFLFGMGLKGGAEVVWNNWHSSHTPFGVEELVSARKLARGGAEVVWKGLRESIGVGLMGTMEPLAVLEERSMNESSSEGESDDDEMEI